MKTLTLLMLVSLLVPVMALAETPPSIPLAVYGSVKIDNQPAPIGTVVATFNGAAEVARATTTQAGKYFLKVPANNAGIMLSYKVNGISAAEKTAANPVSQASDKIDLAITTPAAPAVSQPAPTARGNSGGASGGSSGDTASSNNLTPTPATPARGSASKLEVEPLAPTPPLVAPQVLGEKIGSAQALISKILNEAGLVIKRNWGAITRDAVKEKNAEKKYIASLIKGLKSVTLDDAQKTALNDFITYGTDTTKILGEGERAGVISSYKSAFGKLPKTETEWQDALKIASGRWPSERVTAAETTAKTSFKKIYARTANMDKTNDNAAVTVMAYGLRPSARNLNSERAAILAFKHFIKRAPAEAADWDIVRAIAYSGAKR